MYTAAIIVCIFVRIVTVRVMEKQQWVMVTVTYIRKYNSIPDRTSNGREQWCGREVVLLVVISILLL